MELMQSADFKNLWVNPGTPLGMKSKAERLRAHKAISRVEACCRGTLLQMIRHFDGAELDRDYDLRTYAKKIRRDIMEKNGRWLPKYVFRDRPFHLFWVEGTSKAILYNYIPVTDKNVYRVADAELILHYDVLINKLQFVKDTPRFGRVLCENTMVFDTDLVSTTDPVLKERHAQGIAYFSKSVQPN